MKSILFLIFISFCFSKQSPVPSKPEVILNEEKRIVRNGESDFLENEYVYIVESDIIIERGGRLTIEAGTTLKFSSKTDINQSGRDAQKTEIIVHGELIADGESGSEGMIIFTSFQAEKDRRAGDWHGITIYKNKDNKESRIVNSRVEYATSAINIIGSNPLIVGNWLNFNLENAIYVSARSQAVIAFNQIYDNIYTGIDIRFQGKPKLFSNLIYRNKFGIMIFDSSQPQLGDKSKREVIIGENALKGENVLSGANAFFENSSFDIYNNSLVDIVAENNSWDTYSSNRGLQNIEKRIYDKNDKPSVSSIDFLPINPKLKMEEKYLRRSHIDRQINEMKNQKSRINTFQNILSIRSTPNSGIDAEELTVSDSTRLTKTDSLDAEAVTLNAGFLSHATKQSPVPDIYLDPGSGEIISQPEPVYTGQARTQNINGNVKLRIVVDVNGKVENANVIHSDHSLLNQLAINDAVKISYAVGFLKGQRVYFVTSIELHYSKNLVGTAN